MQGQAVGAALQAADQLDAAQGAAVAHGRYGLANAVEKLAQVELGNRQAAFQGRLFVQVTQLEFAEGAQLVGRQFQAVPFGDLCGLVEQQLTLGGEGQGFALEGFARGFAGQFQVFQLVALEGAVEAQLALQLGAGAQHRLIAGEEGAQLHGDAGAFAHGAGAQLDIFGAVLLAAFGVAVVDARVAQGQAVDVQAQRLAGGCFGAAGGCRAGGGGAGIRRFGGLGGAADVLPVAMALFVALQGQVEAVDADIAHLHFFAQQRQHAHRQAQQAQVGKRLVRRGGAGQGGVG